MRQLTKAQSVVMLAGAFLMVLGAVLYVVGVQTFSPWLFALGVGTFVAMQARQTYEGRDFVIRRLMRIRGLGEAFFVLAALLMIENSYHLLLPLFMAMADDGYYMYVTYVHNNWVLLLLAAAIIQLYTTHRIASEIAKESKKI